MMASMPSPISTMSPTNSVGSASSELEAASRRLQAAQQWEANATNMLEAAQRDVNNARSNLSDARTYLPFRYFPSETGQKEVTLFLEGNSWEFPGMSRGK